MTRAADSQQRSSILVRADDGRRRPSDLRVALVASAQQRVTDDRVHVAARDRHPCGPAALFHDANAPPPATVPTVAGLDA
jgi:hypothetical protein